MDLREAARAWLIDAKYGLIDSRELVARADRAIRELDSPPDFILALSLKEPLHQIPRLDLVKEPVTSQDLSKLASRILGALESGDMSIEKVADISIGVAIARATDEAMVWLHFNWIADNAFRLDEGDEFRSDFKEGAIAELEKAATPDR